MDTIEQVERKIEAFVRELGTRHPARLMACAINTGDAVDMVDDTRALVALAEARELAVFQQAGQAWPVVLGRVAGEAERLAGIVAELDGLRERETFRDFVGTMERLDVAGALVRIVAHARTLAATLGCELPASAAEAELGAAVGRLTAELAAQYRNTGDSDADTGARVEVLP